MVEELQRSFLDDLVEGLSRTPKQISPRYLYDDLGSALFEAITRLPEYGVTRSEEKLLLDCARQMVALLPRRVEVVELGSGSGRKTEIVLRALMQADQLESYTAIDVSEAALEECRRRLQHGLSLDVRTESADYIEGLQRLAAQRGAVPMVVMFLGSNIGNFGRQAAADFLCGLGETLGGEDSLMIGFDLPKPVDKLLRAYDDPIGLTAAFNKNVLARANRELGCDFNLDDFRHVARWNEAESAVEMHLECLRSHTVRVHGSRRAIRLEREETIWTESSHKYSLPAMRQLGAQCGFVERACEIESEWGFAESIWTLDDKTAAQRR